MKIIKFINNNWKDPVWSKVIAWGIITLLTIILTSIWIIIKLLINGSSISLFLSVVEELISISITIPKWLFLSLIILSLTSIIHVVCQYVQQTKSNSTIEETDPIINRTKSDVLFHDRLTDAYPGIRGLIWLHKQEAAKRLNIIFKEPFHFNHQEGNLNLAQEQDPFWWFRGTSSLPIRQFKYLRKNLVLINNYELKINSMAAFISDSRYLNFLYLNIEGDKPSGVYPNKKNNIGNDIESFGYSSERVGLYEGNYIKGEEYDDGSIIRKGQHIKLKNAELRIRILSDYNLIIVPKSSSFNSKKFDLLSEPYFKDIIKKKILPEAFFDIMKDFAKSN